AIARELDKDGFIHVKHQIGQPALRPKRQNAVRLTNSYINAADASAGSRPLTEQQQRVIQFLKESPWPPSFSELLERVEVSAAVVRTLEKRGLVEVCAREVRRDPLSRIGQILPEPSALVLTPQQSEALEKIIDPLKCGEYATFLLHGVTGAGKTEIYMRAMRAAMEMGKTAMMLVPEIALTPMFSRRLFDQFGDAVAILHSSLSDGERLDEWQRVYLGQARVVIGTRSAVFAPLQNLGLVVVDEEHETSYKQEETPRYNGRDTAIVRALNV